MPFRIVQSKQNSRVRELRRALTTPVRSGPVGIEGPNLLHEALRAGLRIHCVFVSAEELASEQENTLPPGTEILLLPEDLLRSVLTTETPQPVAALVDPPDWTWAQVLGMTQSAAPLIVLLAGLQDPGNLGTILRSAEAFGANGVICLPGTVSAWNPKAVRASAGSVFRVPVISATPESAFSHLRAAGIEALVATATAAPSADRVRLAHATAFLIGNEGNGVPDEIAALADGAIRVPCPGPVESLNAAVAASVLLYEASQQRALPSESAANRRREHP
jgi:RNA methyltransferase, TrmH family